eukprot:959857-Rhodomonas_salina.1
MSSATKHELIISPIAARTYPGPSGFSWCRTIHWQWMLPRSRPDRPTQSISVPAITIASLTLNALSIAILSVVSSPDSVPSGRIAKSFA